jgi:hypothetical protein
MCEERRGWRSSGAVVLVVMAIVLAAGAASAQVGTATIEGRVADETGATLPGVTVTISSPALQVRQMVDLTETNGQYRFTDVPIGVYRVEYMLQGFSQVVREGVRLNAGFVARLDIELKVGSLQETVTVSGLSPVVDTATTAGITNFTKEMLETAPNTKSMWQVLAMTPGVRPAGTPDVGGSELGNQQGYKNYGTTGQVTPQLEGLNTRQAETTAGFFYDYAALEEAQVKAVGNDAEVALPGTNWVAIVKSGGNDFHGAYSAAGQHKTFQSNNLDDALRSQGITTGTGQRHFWDLAGDLGGRLVRDKLWFYTAFRDQRKVSDLVGYSRTAGPDGEFGTTDDEPGYSIMGLTNQTIKVSYQPAQAWKAIGFYQRNLKREPERDGNRFTPMESTLDYNFPTRAAKGEIQAVPSGRLLANFLFGRQWYDAFYNAQEGVDVPGNPSRLDRETGRVTGPPALQDQRPRSRWQTTGTLSYLPERFLGGQHSFKLGYQVYWEQVGTGYRNKGSGNYQLIYDRVGGLARQPVEINTYNMPITDPANKQTQYSAFLQDRWSIGRRLTANIGLRWDQYHTFVDEQTKVQGQFGNSGTFPAVDVLTWSSIAPRAGLAFDVSGDGKTVVKATYGWFNHTATEDFAAAHNANTLVTTRYHWRDLNRNNDYDEGEVNLALNNNPDFITITGATNNILNPNLQQPVTHEVSLGFEREMMNNLSAKLLYVFKRQNNLYETVNSLRPYSAWSIPITRRDPGPDGVLNNADDGGSVSFFDYTAAYRGAAFVGNERVNAPDNRDSSYNTIEATVQKRMSNRWDILASGSWTKNHRWINAIASTPNQEIFPLDTTSDWQFKLIGSYLMPGDINVSTFFQHLAGDPLRRTYIFRSADPDGGLPIASASTVTLPLEELGASREPNLNMLNLRAGKRITMGKARVSLDVDLFNVLNINSPTAITVASGPTYGLYSDIVPPRILRFGATFVF